MIELENGRVLREGTTKKKVRGIEVERVLRAAKNLWLKDTRVILYSSENLNAPGFRLDTTLAHIFYNVFGLEGDVPSIYFLLYHPETKRPAWVFNWMGYGDTLEEELVFVCDNSGNWVLYDY